MKNLVKHGFIQSKEQNGIIQFQTFREGKQHDGIFGFINTNHKFIGEIKNLQLEGLCINYKWIEIGEFDFWNS